MEQVHTNLPLCHAGSTIIEAIYHAGLSGMSMNDRPPASIVPTGNPDKLFSCVLYNRYRELVNTMGLTPT